MTSTLALLRAAEAKGMRVSQPVGDDGLCAVQCRACGWETPRDVVAARYVAAPHGCIPCSAGRAG